MKLSGSEIIIECLKREGVKYIFGYPGGAVLHIYDALFSSDEIKHVLVRHEQGATHAAGRPAACRALPRVLQVRQKGRGQRSAAHHHLRPHGQRRPAAAARIKQRFAAVEVTAPLMALSRPLIAAEKRQRCEAGRNGRQGPAVCPICEVSRD